MFPYPIRKVSYPNRIITYSYRQNSTCMQPYATLRDHTRPFSTVIHLIDRTWPYTTVLDQTHPYLAVFNRYSIYLSLYYILFIILINYNKIKTFLFYYKVNLTKPIFLIYSSFSFNFSCIEIKIYRMIVYLLLIVTKIDSEFRSTFTYIHWCHIRFFQSSKIFELSIQWLNKSIRYFNYRFLENSNFGFSISVARILVKFI